MDGQPFEDDGDSAAAAARARQRVDDLNLEGAAALALHLVERFGSLEAAYNWFDYSKRGVTSSQFTTGLKVLRLDLVEIMGSSPMEVFGRFSRGGLLTRGSWDDLFNTTVGARPKGWDAARRGARKLTAMRALNTKKVRAPSSKPSKETFGSMESITSGPGRSPEEEAREAEVQRLRAIQEEERRVEQAAKEAAAAAAAETQRKMAEAETRIVKLKQAEEVKRLEEQKRKAKEAEATERKRLAEEEAQRLAEEAAKRKEEEARVEVERVRLAKEAEEKRRQEEEQRLAEEYRRKEEEKLRLKREEEERLKEAARPKLNSSVEQSIRALTSDGSIAIDCQRTERTLIEQLAQELGFRSFVKESASGGTRVVVLNEGKKARLMQKNLQHIKGGESILFEHLSEADVCMMRTVSGEVGQWCFDADSKAPDTSFNVFNPNAVLMEDFATGLKTILEGISDGNVLQLPNMGDNDIQKCWALKAIQELELSAQEANGRISVGNFKSFEQQVANELRVLPTGKGKTYSCKHPMQQEIVKLVAESLNMTVAEPKVSKTEVSLTVRRHKGGGTRDDADTKLKEKIGDVFDQYASGAQSGVAVMLRRPDLDRFVEELHRRAKEVAGGELERARREQRAMALRDARHALECVFDEVLDLQFDLGCRITSGLTLDYLQVFLSKAADEFGWSMASFLLLLVPDADEALPFLQANDHQR